MKSKKLRLDDVAHSGKNTYGAGSGEESDHGAGSLEDIIDLE